MPANILNRRYLPLTLLLLLSMGMAQSHAGEAIPLQPKPLSKFYELVNRISAADILQRHDFSIIALSELIHVYQESYQTSFNEQPTEQQAQIKLARWRKGLSDFIDQLKAIKQNINFEDRFTISVVRSGPVVIYINETPIVLSGPEIAKTSIIEQRITEQFCRLHNCESSDDTPVRPPVTITRVPAGTWQLKHSKDARYITRDGLTFIFNSLDQRAQKQQFCETIANDIRRLVSHIRQAQESGYPIDWNRLSISTLHDGKTEQIIINSNGDYINMDFKSLNQNSIIDKRLLMWARMQLAGKPLSIEITDADRFWEGREE